MKSGFSPVPHSKLQIGYTPVLTSNKKDPIFVEVPGFGHEGKHYTNLSEELAQRNIGTLMLDFKSTHRNILSRNAISLDTYKEGIGQMIDHFQHETGRKITGLIGHSQGGLLAQEWLQEQPDETLAGIFLAPVPLSGAKEAVLRIARQHPVLFAKFLQSFFTKTGLKSLSNEEVRLLFFDEDTPEDIIAAAKENFVHTPITVFLQDIFRAQLRPKLQKTDRPTLLITSPTDALFPPKSYNGLDEIYPNIKTATAEGGHDFFIGHAKETAELIQDFLERKNILDFKK